MANFSVSPNTSRYRITGSTVARYSLPPSSGVALGEGLLFGLPGGALLALPVALRSGASFERAGLVWLAALGLYGMLLSVLAAALRVARPMPRRTPALLLGLLMAVGPLALLGMMLARHTHHRPLGAATYSVVAALIVSMTWAISNQALLSLHSPLSHRRNFGWFLIVFCGVISLGMGALPILGFLQGFGKAPLLSSIVIDGLFGVALTMFGGFARFPHKLEANARVLGTLAFGVCVAAFAIAMQSPETGPALARACALWAWLG